MQYGSKRIKYKMGSITDISWLCALISFVSVLNKSNPAEFVEPCTWVVALTVSFLNFRIVLSSDADVIEAFFFVTTSDIHSFLQIFVSFLCLNS